MGKRRHLSLAPQDSEGFFEAPTKGPSRAARATRGGQRGGRGDARAAGGRQRGAEQPRAERYVKNLAPRTEGQARLLAAIDASDITLAIGPAGTGKTYLAVARAVDLLQAGAVDRIVLSRPAVEAGERLGFLPGGVKDKVDPYMRPIYDALFERMGAQKAAALIEIGVIEIAPIAFLRGRTLARAAIVVDEAQNCTRGQMAMVLTRLGTGSKMILTGDPTQVDLLPGDSGLAPVADEIEGRDPAVSVVRLTEADVVRHRTVQALLPHLARVVEARAGAPGAPVAQVA